MAEDQLYINGQWIGGSGGPLSSTDPATGRKVYSGHAASSDQVGAAVRAARAAIRDWAKQSLDDRIACLNRFCDQLERRRSAMRQIISRETGKPRWEAEQEVNSMIGKITLSVDAYHQRRGQSNSEVAGATAATRYKPHGVVAVLGPFNLPGHLPNGHIVPALLAGNTVVFKPSELAPAVGELTVRLWHDAGIPAGVINLVQGQSATGTELVGHRQVDGVFFTGGCRGGLAIHKALAEQPQKILALEMGGNNPLVIHDVVDVDAAACLSIQSAFATAGQRCTCARRLIITNAAPVEAFLNRLAELIDNLRVGPFTAQPEPFMGPVISAEAAKRLLRTQENLIDRGASPIVPMTRLGNGGALLRPGILDMSYVENCPDEEWFGPLLQLLRVDDLETAIDLANDTAYGLSAALLCDDPEAYEQFYLRIRAGVINWNRPTTGASSGQPFGGVGISGNHHPSGYHAADYCSYPVASLESPTLSVPQKLPPGIEL